MDATSGIITKKNANGKEKRKKKVPTREAVPIYRRRVGYLKLYD